MAAGRGKFFLYFCGAKKTRDRERQKRLGTYLIAPGVQFPGPGELRPAMESAQIPRNRKRGSKFGLGTRLRTQTGKMRKKTRVSVGRVNELTSSICLSLHCVVRAGAALWVAAKRKKHREGDSKYLSTFQVGRENLREIKFRCLLVGRAVIL